MSNYREIQEQNKAVVRTFNAEVIERGHQAAVPALVSEHFVNRSAGVAEPSGMDGMLYVFNEILRPAFPDLKVEIIEQLAVDDKVITRKQIRGTHRGPLLGIEPTNEPVAIDVIDIVRVEDGKYVEHWGVNTFLGVMAALRAKA